MKYIKQFENSQDDNIAFSVGDIVVCVHNNFPTVGTKLIAESIFIYSENMTQITLKHITESQHDQDHFVTVKNMEGNNTHNSIWSTRFVSEMKYNEMKYNI